MNLSPWPHYDSDQIAAATRVLSSGKVNTWTGLETTNFENDFSSFCGTNYSIALSNGTLALSAAYQSVGLGVGDELITSPRTFIATASSAVLLGATPVFADVDSQSGCITTSTIEPLITPRTKAISVVHLGGWPADMPDICNLAHSYNIAIVEDCAQAHGARIGDQSVGSFADVSAWSFCQDKIITTSGEGGMITTNNPELFEFIWSLKDHGKSYKASLNPNHPAGFRWLHDSFGSNFRLTELQSSIGIIQLKRLTAWNAIRSRNALLLTESLRELSVLRIPLPPDGITHAWYKYYVYLKPAVLASGWTRNRIMHEINILGYPCLSGGCSEIYLEKCFVDAGLTPTSPLPIARELGETSLMFLVHPTITTEQMVSYAHAIKSVLMRASR